MPDNAVVEVLREILPAIHSTKLRERFERNVGPNFGTEFHHGYAEWPADAIIRRDDDLSFFENAVSFDAAVVNGDRKKDPSNLIYNGDKFLLIDHSVAVPFLHPQNTGQRPDASGYVPEPSFIRSWIPAEWETNAGDLDFPFSFIEERPESHPDLSKKMREVLK